jgi:hypothetical protein
MIAGFFKRWRGARAEATAKRASFLIGLSNVEADRTRNLELLNDSSWFDIPVVYANQRRAIIAIEKGALGNQIFNDAFAAWGQR